MYLYNKNHLGLYIHVPYCSRKCKYCDFLSFPVKATEHKAYIDQLLREIKLSSLSVKDKYTVSTVFIGGGTPSLLETEFIKDIMEAIKSCYKLSNDAEITIECNPASTLRYKFRDYLDAGINRISFGLQSANNDELKTLGRIHIYEDFLKAYESARLEGFKNINIDLMNDIPGQTPSSWRNTIKQVTMLRPEHLSIYNLIIEEGTPFYRLYNEGKLILPSEEEKDIIDEITWNFCEKNGYERYEVSNFAKEGYQCKHNLSYWSDTPYLGFGLGASSYFEDCRIKNTSDYKSYLEFDMENEFKTGCRNLKPDLQILSRESEMEEFVFLGMRKIEGISEIYFKQKFSVDINSVYGDILKKYMNMGLIVHEGSYYRLTKRGMDVSNVILSDFLLS